MEAKSKPCWALLCFIAHLTWYLSSAKVVVFFPFPVVSHARYHTNVARATGAIGHEAWVCIPDYLREDDQIDMKGINILHYGHTLGHIGNVLSAKAQFNKQFWNNGTQSVSDILSVTSFFDELVASMIAEGLVDRVKDLKPDLFVIDGIPLIKSIHIVPYKLDVPYAILGTVHDVSAYRIPFSPAATPLQLGTLNDRMNFWARCQSALTYFVFMTGSSILERDVVSEFAPEKPHKSLSELMAGAEVYIVEIDPIMDYPRPMLPNTKLVGGTAVRKAKYLNEPFKSFVDNSKTGVIVISFGTRVLDVPEYIFNKIHTACKRSGLNIVWRSDQPSPDTDKILTNEWIPQNDILGHNNTKLFISHCGKNGQYEALYHGVPILCLPFYADQPYNAERVRAKGYGLKADMRSISTDDLSDMIKEIITNTTYKTNIAKASKLFRLLYKSPMKEAAFWLDHVMEFGGDYMRAASQKMPYYQFLMLDVLAVVLCVIHVMGFVLFFVIRSFIRFCLRTKPSKSKSE